MSSTCSSRSGSNSRMFTDPFNAVFDNFKKLLSSSAVYDDNSGSKLAVNGVDLDFYFHLEKKLHDSTISQLNRIRKLRTLALKCSTSKLRMESIASQTVESSSSRAVNTCHRQRDATTRCLHQHVQAAECRLRDLTSDIIGEYLKTQLRFVRRRDYLLDIAAINLIEAVSKLRWQRFTLRLCSESNTGIASDSKKEGLHSRVLCPRDDRVEVQDITAAIARMSTAALDSKLVSSQFDVRNVVRISKKQNRRRGEALRTAAANAGTSLPTIQSAPSMRSQNQRNCDSTNLYHTKPCFITTPAAFMKGVEQFCRWADVGGSSILDQCDEINRNIKPASLPDIGSIHRGTSELLSAAHIAWLQPASFYPHLWTQIMIDQRHTECDSDISGDGAAAGGSSRSCVSRHAADMNMNTTRTKAKDRLHDFVATLTLQHTSVLASDRVYFCLEERALSMATRAADVDCLRLDASVDRDCAMSGLYEYLQTCYCSSRQRERPGTDDAHDIDIMRKGLVNDPLYFQEYTSCHSAGLHGQDSDDEADPLPLSEGMARMQDIKALANAFPDVIKVVTRAGQTLHFSPASPLNYLESSRPDLCKYASTVSSSNSGVRAGTGGQQDRLHSLDTINNPSALKYPVPNSLDRLFCLVHVTPFSHVAPVYQVPQEQRERRQSIASEETLAQTQRTKTDLHEAASDSFHVMVPLSDACMRELAKSVLPLPESIQSSSSDILQLLPDRACSRAFDLVNLQAGDSEGGQTCDQDMEHKYVIISKSDLLQQTSKESIGKWDENSETDGSEAFYFIQISGSEVTSNADMIGSADAGMGEDELLRCLFANSVVADTYGHADEVIAPSALKDCKARPCSSDASQLLSAHHSSQVPYTTLQKHGDKQESVAGKRIDYRDKGEEKLAARANAHHPSVLSTLCWWRSCQSEASSTTSNLCAYHSDLKSFLDRDAVTSSTSTSSANSAPSDALKYLPRRVSTLPCTPTASTSVPEITLEQYNESYRDYFMIRAASPLLQELGEGKLKCTIRSFIRRSGEETRCKRRLEAAAAAAAAASSSRLQLFTDSLEQHKCIKPLLQTSPRQQTGSARSPSSGTRTRTGTGTARLVELHGAGARPAQSFIAMPSLLPSPVWAKWKNEDLLSSTLQDLTDMRRLLLSALEIEKQVTLEVRALSHLRIYPLKELLAIRNGAKLLLEKFKRTELDEDVNEFWRYTEKNSSSADSLRKGGTSAVLESSRLLQGVHGIEARALIDTPSAPRLEYLLAERKLSVLTRRRRTEQEARDIQVRRIAKYRAVQESQDQRPSTFSNSSAF